MYIKNIAFIPKKNSKRIRNKTYLKLWSIINFIVKNIKEQKF